MDSWCLKCPWIRRSKFSERRYIRQWCKQLIRPAAFKQNIAKKRTKQTIEGIYFEPKLKLVKLIEQQIIEIKREEIPEIKR